MCNRRLIATAVEALILDDPGGHWLHDLRDLGTQLDAIDRVTNARPG